MNNKEQKVETSTEAAIVGNTLLAEVKTAKDKCIGKWEKRLKKAREQKQRWGDSYWNNYTERIATYEEIISDLKRV